jgi:hypothetical protein
MDKTVVDFFEKHAANGHYDLIKNRPDQYKNWDRDDTSMYEYAKWIEFDSGTPSLKLDLPTGDMSAMAAEAESLLHEFVDHRGELHPEWYSLTIHGSGKHITEDWNSSIYNGRWKERPKYNWTEIAEQCPSIVNWLTDVWTFKEFHRVRLMLLRPGGYILPHTDYEVRKLAAYNMAITNPPGTEFCMEDAGLIPWKVGDVRAIDIGRQHSVRNIGHQDRIHMIIHGVPSPEHRRVLCRSYDMLLSELGKL